MRNNANSASAVDGVNAERLTEVAHLGVPADPVPHFEVAGRPARNQGVFALFGDHRNLLAKRSVSRVSFGPNSSTSDITAT